MAEAEFDRWSPSIERSGGRQRGARTRSADDPSRGPWAARRPDRRPETAANPDRRSALVQEAFRAIAERGLEGLRLRAVAAAAGIDHSTLHHHFATKQDLIVAVVQQATEPLRSTVADDGSARERLDAHLATLAEMMQSRPDLFVVLAEIDLRARRDPDVAVAVSEVEAGWRLALTGLFRDSRISADPKDMTELTIAAVKGVRLDPAAGSVVLTTLRTLLSRTSADTSQVGVL